ncbi:MAG: DUF2125 domain-containing protein [Mesorhizobium sp.]
MSSSEAKPTYSRRFMWLAIFIALLIGAYTAGWFYLAGKVTERVNATLALVNGDGVTAECANPVVRGYPFRLELSCDSLGYEDAGRNIVATAGSLSTAAQVYQPMRVVAELDGPLRAALPGLPQLWLDWDNLRASARLARPLPQILSVEAGGFSGQTDPDEGDPVMLFSAEKVEGHLRPNGADLDAAGSFAGLEIDAAAVGGRTVPVLNGSGDATLANGVAFVLSKAASLRGQSGTIRSLDLSTGPNTGVSLSGTFSVGADGLLDADLKVGMRDPKGVAAALSTAFPEAAREISNGFAGLALLGNAPSMPLKIVRGKAMLGFIPLAEIPPLS